VDLIGRLEERYKIMIGEESEVINKTRQEIGIYVDELQRKSGPALPQEATKVGDASSAASEGSSQN
jgi:hypothetical protein